MDLIMRMWRVAALSSYDVYSSSNGIFLFLFLERLDVRLAFVGALCFATVFSVCLLL